MKLRRLKHRATPARHLSAMWVSWANKIVRKIMPNESYGKLAPQPCALRGNNPSIVVIDGLSDCNFDTRRAEMREEYASGFDSVAED